MPLLKKLLVAVLAFIWLAGSLNGGGWGLAGNVAYADFSDASTIDETFQYAVSQPEYRSYLWVPESASFIRGVIVVKANLNETNLVYSRTIRDMAREQKLGIMYFMAFDTADGMYNQMFNNFYNQTDPASITGQSNTTVTSDKYGRRADDFSPRC